MLIAFAYNIRGAELLGGPGWVRSEKYDVAAKADGDGNRSQDEVKAMLRTLMADRFNLAIHRENRLLSVYALTVDKNGPKFAEAREPIDASTPASRATRSHVTATRMTMASLAGTLMAEVRGYVFDETGLTGRYAFTLDWTPDDTPLWSSPRRGFFRDVHFHSATGAIRVEAGVRETPGRTHRDRPCGETLRELTGSPGRRAS